MAQPKSFLVQILITVPQSGPVKKTIRSFYDGTIVNGPLQVNVGDHVGFVVQVYVSGNRKTLPFTVRFEKPSFFGVDSIEVLSGGASDMLTVRTLQDITKYFVDIPGIVTADPDIQSGGDTGDNIVLMSTDQYILWWDTNANTMKYSKNAGAYQPLPLTVSAGDQVSFQASSDPAVTQNFAVTFAQTTNGWASPFDANSATFVANAGPTVINPPGVGDREDPGASFPFSATITVNGAPINFPPAPDPNAKIVMHA